MHDRELLCLRLVIYRQPVQGTRRLVGAAKSVPTHNPKHEEEGIESGWIYCFIVKKLTAQTWIYFHWWAFFKMQIPLIISRVSLMFIFLYTTLKLCMNVLIIESPWIYVFICLKAGKQVLSSWFFKVFPGESQQNPHSGLSLCDCRTYYGLLRIILDLCITENSGGHDL